jgi:heme exporter protein B
MTTALAAAPPGAVSSPPSALRSARIVCARDLRVAFRRREQIVQPLAFFALVTTLFPLSISPELSQLRPMASGVLWVGALLASLLALEFLFRDDALDGTLEQYALSGRSLTWLLFAKTVSHWLLTGLPLALLAPVLGAALGVPSAAMPEMIGALLLGTLSLSLLGAIVAALTLGVKRSGVLLSLLMLPLAVPILIFGSQATGRAMEGGSFAAPMYMLGAFAVLGVTLAPLAAAGAVRISLE